MSFTRLAGARSSSGFLAKSVRPSGSSSKTASAESDSGRPSATDRPGWAVAARGAKAATSTARAASVRPRCTGTDSSERSKRPASKNRSADGLLQLFRRFEARNASGDRHRLARARVLERAGLAPRHGKRSEADERDRIASLERSADPSERNAESALRSGLRPPGRRYHPHHDLGLRHEPLHPKRTTHLIHHGLVDGRVPVLGREPLDRAPGHRPDERWDPLDPRFGLGRQLDPRRRPVGSLFYHGRERASGALPIGARATPAIITTSC